MTDPTDKADAEALDGEIFLEDVEAQFDWKSVPLEGWVCIPIFWTLAGVVFWQFFTRYALDNAAVWTEEVARQLLILLTFFGVAYALRTRSHISISYFVDRLRGRARTVIREVNALIQLAFYAYSFWLCLQIAELTAFQRLMSVDLSKSVVYYAVALSFAAMVLRCIADLYSLIRRYRAQTRGGRVPTAASLRGNGADT